MGRCKQALEALASATERIGTLEKDVAGLKESLAAVKAALRERNRTDELMAQLVREQQGILAGALERAQTPPQAPPFTYPDRPLFSSPDDEEEVWQIAQGLRPPLPDEALDPARDALRRAGMDDHLAYVPDETID